MDLSWVFHQPVLLHHATNGDNAMFLFVILGIAAATVVAMIRSRRSR